MEDCVASVTGWKRPGMGGTKEERKRAETSTERCDVREDQGATRGRGGAEKGGGWWL